MWPLYQDMRRRDRTDVVVAVVGIVLWVFIIVGLSLNV